MAAGLSEYDALARKVLGLARSMLLVNMRFMDSAISRFVFTPYPLGSIGTDARRLFYSPRYVLRSYKKEQNRPVRAYLHCLLHCIFRHMFVNPDIDRPLWDLACDIAVENSILDLDLRSGKAGNDAAEKQFIEKIKTEIRMLTAEKVYSWLKSRHNHDDYSERLAEVFTVDDHSFWYMPPEDKNSSSEDPDRNGDKQQASEPGNNDPSNEPGNGDPRSGTPTWEELEQMWKNISEQVKTAQEMCLLKTLSATTLT